MQATTKLDENGHEILSDVPLSLPMGFKKPETLAESVARLVRSDQWRKNLQPEDETFEEADDFDVGDDFDPSSPFEQVFDFALQRDISPAQFLTHQEEYAKLYAAHAVEEQPAPEPDPAPEPEPAPETGEK